MSNKKTIFISLISDRDGGLEESFVFYSNLLIEMRHEVFLLTPISAPYLSRINSLARRIKFHPKGYWDVFSAIRLSLIVRKYAPDIMLGYNSRASYYISGIAKLFSKTKSIGYSHSYKYKKLRFCDSIICVTEDMKSFFLDNGFKNRSVEVLPPIGLELEKNSEAHSTKDLNSDSIRVGFLGRMTPEKGILKLIKAMSNVHLSKKIKLVIGGDGPEFEAAKNLSKQLGLDAYFIGWVKTKENFFNQIDVLVIPSESETFGIVALEAMIRRIPVVSTPTNGAKSIIVDGKSGLISDGFDEISLSRAIAKLDNLDLKIVVAEGHKRALSFDKETVKGRFKATIDKL